MKAALAIITVGTFNLLLWFHPLLALGREGADATTRHVQNIRDRDGEVRVSALKFTHLTSNDGLSQGYVTAILQDHRGFMWLLPETGSIAMMATASSFTKTTRTTLAP